MYHSVSLTNLRRKPLVDEFAWVPTMTNNYPPDWDRRRKAAYERDDYKCQNCGAKGGPEGHAELHAHHGVPVSKGGSHQISNLITYCEKCHSAIHNNSLAPTATEQEGSQITQSEQPRDVELNIPSSTSANRAIGIGLLGSFLIAVLSTIMGIGNLAYPLALGIPLTIASQYIMFWHENKIHLECIDARNELDTAVLLWTFGISVSIGFLVFARGLVSIISASIFSVTGITLGILFYRDWRTIQNLGRWEYVQQKFEEGEEFADDNQWKKAKGHYVKATTACRIYLAENIKDEDAMTEAVRTFARATKLRTRVCNNMICGNNSQGNSELIESEKLILEVIESDKLFDDIETMGD